MKIIAIVGNKNNYMEDVARLLTSYGLPTEQGVSNYSFMYSNLFALNELEPISLPKIVVVDSLPNAELGPRYKDYKQIKDNVYGELSFINDIHLLLPNTVIVLVSSVKTTVAIATNIPKRTYAFNRDTDTATMLADNIRRLYHVYCHNCS
jgi:hypothetical protein